ncbi:MAG: sigma factor, partial [Aggregatilineales bacterium]
MTQQAGDFEQYRQTLFGLAYRLLGSAMDAEDIVQDAYLRYQKTIQTQTIDAPKAFLRRTVTNLCLDYLKSARVQREEYIGTWLPEPVLTDEGSAFTHPVKSAEIAESISMAFMVM